MRALALSPAALAAAVAVGEGRELELKRGLPRDEKTARTLCAFANTRGGLLVIGMLDRGEVHGVPDVEGTIARLETIAAEALDPPLELRFAAPELPSDPLRRAGPRVIVASVPLSSRRPHRVLEPEPRAYVRDGSSNREATPAHLERIAAERAYSVSLSAFEAEVLDAVARASAATGDAGLSVEGFLARHDAGRQRVRRAFARLERGGRIEGHGIGDERAFRAVR